MSFLYVGQVVAKQVRFSGSVTGTPTAQMYVEGVASGSPVNGTGSGATWVFEGTVPSADIGLYVTFEASAVVSGVTQYVMVVEGAIVEIEPLDALGIGTGARTVTITVTVDSVATQGAKIRVTKGGETYLQLTNVSGVATFNLDDGTWVVAITSPGATFAGASLVVDGTETVTYDMDVITVIASDPDKVTAFYACLDEEGNPEEGIEVTLKAKEALDSLGVVDGIALSDVVRTAESDEDGIASFINVLPGCVYVVQCSGRKEFLVEIPSDADDPFPLRSIVR